MRAQGSLPTIPSRARRQVFGGGLWPDTSAGNNNTGGAAIAASDVFFVNGGLDPWRQVSVTTARGSIGAAVMDCEGCAHCRDLKASAASDPEAVRSAHDAIRQHVARWIGGGLTADAASSGNIWLGANARALGPR